MSHSQPMSANVYDIAPIPKSYHSKYQRSLPMSQRIANLRKNGKTSISNPPAPPSTITTGVVINTKHFPRSNSIEIYECLPAQSKLPSATQKWIQTILRSLNPSHNQSSKNAPPSTHQEAIPIYPLSTDLNLNHKYYQNEYFVSLLNIIFAGCLQHEFLSKEFVHYISDHNVQQFRTKTFERFASQYKSTALTQYTEPTEDIESLFVTMFKRPALIVEQAKDIDICSQNLSNISKHNIHGLDAYKPLHSTNKYITLHAFKNPASGDENERNRVAVEFRSVCEALRANKDKIGLSIFYSVTQMHYPWCYIVQFKDPTGCDMPHLETDEKSNKKSQSNSNNAAEPIVLDDDDDDDVDMNASSKANDKEEHDDDDDERTVDDTPQAVMNGINESTDEELRKALEASKISHNKEQHDEEELGSFDLTFDETQANTNHNKHATSTEPSSDNTVASTPQRISSQPRVLSDTLPAEDAAVEMSLNCSANKAAENTNYNDLDATLMDETLDLNYPMSDKSSPVRARPVLPATMIVDDEDSYLELQIEEDTVDVRKEDTMSQILSNNHELDLEMDDDDSTQHNEPQSLVQARTIDIIEINSDDESQDLSVKPNENQELKMEQLDTNEETEEDDVAMEGAVMNERQQMIDNLKPMGIEQGLIEFVLDEIAPNEKDASRVVSLCFQNAEYYKKNKKKMQKKKTGAKRGKKRKREEDMEADYEQEEEEQEEEEEEEQYEPPIKKRRFGLRSASKTRSRRKAKVKYDYMVTSDTEESENEVNTNNYRNKNRKKPKPKKTKKKKKQEKAKRTKPKDSKVFKDLKEETFAKSDLFEGLAHIDVDAGDGENMDRYFKA
eukprot:516136_1